MRMFKKISNEWVNMSGIAIRVLSLMIAVTCFAATAYAENIQFLMQAASQTVVNGNFRAAEKQYRAILKQNAEQPQAILGLATALKAQGKTKEAVSLLETLISKRPDFQPAYYLLGLMYEKQGDLERAKQAYRTYVAIAPNNVPPDPDLRIKLRELNLF